MMNKLFRKKLTRGGFTLAELLIVVAIIAILVAIAMPIFVNGLNDAQYRVVQADARDIRAAAVEEILTHWNEKTSGSEDAEDVLYSAGAASDDNGWTATAYVDEAGHISDLKISVVAVNAEESTVTVVSASGAKSAVNVTSRDAVLELGGLNKTYTKYFFRINLKSLSTVED